MLFSSIFLHLPKYTFAEEMRALKYMIITKKAIFIIFVFCLAVSVAAACVTDSTVQTGASAKKLIPIYCVETDEKRVAVTFDAAWGDSDTDRLIEILASHNAKATFFIVGEWAQKYPESVKKLYDSGHEIANHSYNHTAYSTLDENEVSDDISKCNAVLESITGETPKLLRSPSGDYTDASEAAAEKANMITVQWSVDSLDWRGISCDEMTKRVLSATESGSIILFHNDVKNTPEALNTVLTSLTADGYSFVSVSQLIYPEPYKIDGTGRQIKQ